MVIDRLTYAVPRQIKPGILKLATSRGQSNLPTVFIFVSCEEKRYYRGVVLVGQLTFDWRSYYGRSRCIQGDSYSFFMSPSTFFLRLVGPSI